MMQLFDQSKSGITNRCVIKKNETLKSRFVNTDRYLSEQRLICARCLEMRYFLGGKNLNLRLCGLQLHRFIKQETLREVL